MLYEQYFIDYPKDRAYLVRMINLFKYCGIAFLLLAFNVGAQSQESPKAVLIDEMEHSGCEDLSARLDSFLHELNSNPNSIGYAVVSSNPDVARRLGWTERFIDGYSRHRGFDESRLIVVRGNLPTPRLIQMWSVPPGAQLSIQSGGETRYEMGPARKRKLYSDFDEVGPCYTGPPFRILSKYLSPDPGLTANVAIGSPSRTSFSAARKEILASFEKEYMIDPSRLRFFWVRTQYEPEIYELWLIRKKSK